MSKHTHQSVLLLGNVGAGKSTLMDILCDHLPLLPVPADKFFQENPFFPLALEDRQRWTFTSNTWFLYKRAQLLKETEQLLEKSDIIIDSGLLMSYAYSYLAFQRGSLSEDEWQLYTDLYQELSRDVRPPDLVLHLQLSIPALQERIKHRGRAYEIEKYNPEFLEMLENAIQHSVDKFHADHPTSVIVPLTESDLDFGNQQQLLRRIQKLLTPTL